MRAEPERHSLFANGASPNGFFRPPPEQYQMRFPQQVRPVLIGMLHVPLAARKIFNSVRSEKSLH